MRSYSLLLAASLSLAGISFADKVELTDGNKLTGKVGTIADGKMKFNSPSLGSIELEMKNVTSFTTDEPVTIRTKSEGTTSDKIAGGDATQITTAGGKTVPTSDVKVINPPKQEWTGSILGTFTLNRGNTNRYGVGANAIASLRRDEDRNDDRFTFGGGYNYGESGGGPPGAPKTLDTDNWNVFAKYDKYWSEKWYGYASGRVEHDRVAALNLRLSPGVGIGYQWWESPKSNFLTEAGLSFIHEDFDPGETSNSVAVRLAYHYDRQLAENVKFFHNLEYLPAIEDPGDYLLNIDAGIRANLTSSFFAEGKVLWKRDSTPAEGSLKNQLDYILGVGWQF